MAEQHLDISWNTIFKVLAIGFSLYVLYLARDIVTWFCFALIISLLVDPVINLLRKFKIPKIVAVILVYLAIFCALGLLVYMVSPFLATEIKQLSQNIPEYFEKANPVLKNLGIEVADNFSEFTKSLVSNLQDNSKSILKAIAGFFGGIATALLVFILAFFISLENKAVENFLIILFPPKFENKIKTIFERAQIKVAGWFGARVLTCLYVGIFSSIIFWILGMKYAITLGIISGALNFIPYIGAAIMYFLATGFALLSGDWVVALYAFVGLLIVQETENKILSPFLMKKFMDMPPILVLVSLLIGGTLFGFLGTVFAVPIFGIIYEFLKEFLESKRQGPQQQAE